MQQKIVLKTFYKNFLSESDEICTISLTMISLFTENAKKNYLFLFPKNFKSIVLLCCDKSSGNPSQEASWRRRRGGLGGQGRGGRGGDGRPGGQTTGTGVGVRLYMESGWGFVEGIRYIYTNVYIQIHAYILCMGMYICICIYIYIYISRSFYLPPSLIHRIIEIISQVPTPAADRVLIFAYHAVG